MSATLAPLSYRPFRLLVAGRVVDMLGSAMGPIALAFAVLDLTHSSTALGVVVASFSLANVVFLLLGGVVADRLPRNIVLLASCTGAAVVETALTLVVATHIGIAHLGAVPLLAGLAALAGALSAFAFPAHGWRIFSSRRWLWVTVEQFGVAWDLSMQQHIPADSLARAYSYDMLGSLVATPLGEVLAGPLAAHFGAWATVLGAAVLAAAAIVAALAVRAVRDLPNTALIRAASPGAVPG